MKPISVVAAVIWRCVQAQGLQPQPQPQIEVLVFQRLASDLGGGSWEFPGGKIDPGESPQEALRREIMEELSIAIEVHESLAKNLHQYPQALIDLEAFRCEPKLANFESAMHLVDHEAYRWVSADELSAISLSAADGPLVAPIFKAAKNHFHLE